MGPSTSLDLPVSAPVRAGHPRDRLAAHALAIEVTRLHGDALLRTARRFAGDPDDAHDAYQRALELLLEHAPTIDRAKVLPWMHVVVRREANALRRRHERHLPFDLDVVDHREASDRTDEQLSRIDLAQRAGDALAALKDAEAQALCLRAQGLTYEEIAEACGWSYTKVNRAVTEGRRAFVDHYLGAERGDVCASSESRIGAYLAGELRPRDQVRLRAHFARCAACRAQLHAERSAGSALQALLPPAVLATSSGHGWLQDHLLAPLGELAARLTPAGEHAMASKVGAVALSTVAVAGGGVTIERQLASGAEPPPAVRPALSRTVPPSSAAAAPVGLAPAAAVSNAAVGGQAMVQESRKRARARERAARQRREAAARRRAARERRTAAAREFAPAATEFSGSSSASPAGVRSGSAGVPAGGSGSGAPSSPGSALTEVPIDTGSSDSGIAVTGETQAP